MAFSVRYTADIPRLTSPAPGVPGPDLAAWGRADAEGIAIAERAALGTTARVAAWPPEDLDLALAAVDTELERLDRQASRFRDDSELSRIHHEPSPVHQLSRGLAEAISVALAAARWTGGLVDPTVGGALIALGYDRDFAAIGPALAGAGRLGCGRARPAAGGAGGPAPAPGWRSVTLEGTVLGLPAGVRLDLGATAKGLGSDRAAAAAYRASGRGGILVSLGGDIAVAGQPPVGGWPVAVADSSDPRRARPGRSADGGRAGHVVGDRPAVAAERAAGAPHRRPPDRVAGGRPVADGERRRRQLRRGQRRQHRGDRGRARRGSVAGRDRAAVPAGGP